MTTKTKNRYKLLPSATSAEQKEIQGGEKTLPILEVD
jgi:hypothetical protein